MKPENLNFDPVSSRVNRFSYVRFILLIITLLSIMWITPPLIAQELSQVLTQQQLEQEREALEREPGRAGGNTAEGRRGTEPPASSE